MQRRDFLRSLLASGALYAGGGLSVLAGRAHAASVPAPGNRILVNIILSGGPDLRHLFTPPFDPNPASYGYRYWEARAAAHAIAPSSSAYQARWNNDYFEVADGGTRFGILGRCGWLKRMWDAGNVAIVCNSVGATTRNHAHCRLVMDQGDLAYGANDEPASGWGGRLASYAGGNVLSLTRTPDRFGYGPPVNDGEKYNNARLISARNTRQLSLYDIAPGDSPYSSRAVISRSLRSYYAALRNEMRSDSVYYRFVEQERMLREFGEPIEDRLATVPVPPAIAALMEGGLNDRYLGEQIRNLYDSFVCSDIFSQYATAMNVGDWDTHHSQRDRIEPKLEDLFGDGRALDVLHQELPDYVTDNTVFLIGGEFGRQLVANGDNGTDHGRGTYVMVIGNQVRGGVYGDMFPEEELERLEEKGPDIRGLTTVDSIYARICDWIQPGTGGLVFPDRSLSTVEAGVNLDSLFV